MFMTKKCIPERFRCAVAVKNVGGEKLLIANASGFFNPRSCMDFIEKYGITFITGVPSTLEMLANRQDKYFHPC